MSKKKQKKGLLSAPLEKGGKGGKKLFGQCLNIDMAVFIQVLPSEPQTTILTDSTSIMEELSSVHKSMILSPSVLMKK